jgi:hypothetical protein
VIAGAAVVYLALLALGLAGPATAPFSLFPGAGDKAGESGTEAVRTGGATANAQRVGDASAGGPLLRGDLPGVVAPGADAVTPTGTQGPGVPATAPTAGTPAEPGASPAASAPPGHSGPPAGSGPKASPPSNPGQGVGPPAGHVPPGQAKKGAGGPANGNDNGPPANRGQQMAAQHSHSPNH